LPPRSNFNREKFKTEYQAELDRLQAVRQARQAAGLQQLREKHWPQWLKYVVEAGLRLAMLRNEGRHRTFETVSAARRASRKARDG
jgi:hypothetical protein